MIAQSTAVAATLPGDISEHARKLPARLILVIDDERLLRWAVAETLGEKGFRVSEAADAESAQRALLTPPSPDLVLLDLCLPDSDDLGLALFIRAHAPATPIVLMTAYATPEILEQAARLGIATVIKPFDMNVLTAIVDGTLASR